MFREMKTRDVAGNSDTGKNTSTLTTKSGLLPRLWGSGMCRQRPVWVDALKWQVAGSAYRQGGDDGCQTAGHSA